MVPIRTKAVSSGRSPKKRDIRPMDTTPTSGQKSSSKKKKTLHVAIRRFRTTTVHTAMAPARQLNEHLLELGLLHLDVPHDDAPVVEPLQQLRHALVGIVHRALHPAVVLRAAQHAGRLAEPRRSRRCELQGHDVA